MIFYWKNCYIVYSNIIQLNKIWKDKEKREIEGLKKKYQAEVLDLRRKISMKSSLKEHNNNKTIIKLKKDLQNTREDLNKHMVQRNKKQI